MYRKALSTKNTPRKFPTMLLVVTFLLQRELDLDPFWSGALWAFVLFVALIMAIDFFTCEEVEL